MTRLLEEEAVGFELEYEEEEVETPTNRRATRQRSKADAAVVEESEEALDKELERLAKSGIRKLNAIATELSTHIFERETVIRDMFLALIAGENILLLGPPGTGKTLLAEYFGQHVTDSFTFKWLMNRTTDPSDIVGPYSVRSMEKDRFRRVTRGRAPKAHLAFFDEIFKSNEPALNFMLSMLNEGIFYNDGKQENVELRLAIGASNEYPETEDLEAFYDRFIFRHWLQYIQDPQTRIDMARASRQSKLAGAKYQAKTQITLEEIDALQEYVFHVKMPAQIEKNYDRLIRSLQVHQLSISDRRYYKGQVAVMAHALLNGRKTVMGNDFEALKYVLWNKDVKDLEIVEKEIAKFANPYESILKDLLKKAEEVKDNTMKIENRTQRAGEVVQANASLKDIMDKMDDEIDKAKADGQDIKPYKQFIDKVEKIMDDLANECLKNSSRPNREW